MEVILPAMLFKKFGLPQATIWRIMAKENRGRQNLSTAFPRTKDSRAKSAQSAIPEQVANAAAQTPHPNTPRNRNSNTPLRTDIKRLRNMLPRIIPLILRKLSIAKTMVVNGEQRAYTRIYCTARDANSPSAPIRRINRGAAANRTPPTATPARTISRQAQVKMLWASFSFFFPRAMAMGTADPTPIRSAREKLMMTKGMARFTAAKAVAPKNRPTKTPSSV